MRPTYNHTGNRETTKPSPIGIITKKANRRLGGHSLKIRSTAKGDNTIHFALDDLRGHARSLAEKTLRTLASEIGATFCPVHYELKLPVSNTLQ
jgi:hypothetical protein